MCERFKMGFVFIATLPQTQRHLIGSDLNRLDAFRALYGDRLICWEMVCDKPKQCLTLLNERYTLDEQGYYNGDVVPVRLFLRQLCLLSTPIAD